MKRRIEVRCEFFTGTDAPVVEIDEEEEAILNAEHEGNKWWIYIARWADADAEAETEREGYERRMAWRDANGIPRPI